MKYAVITFALAAVAAASPAPSKTKEDFSFVTGTPIPKSFWQNYTEWEITTGEGRPSGFGLCDVEAQECRGLFDGKVTMKCDPQDPCKTQDHVCHGERYKGKDNAVTCNINIEGTD